MATELDNFNELVNRGINIYGSRERIRSQIIDYAKEYLDLGTVDFYKTSVISYIIDTLSILSANHIFYDSVIYREFFMVEAQIEESVINLARWIGYTPPKAQPATVDLMFTVPLAFTSSLVQFSIPGNFRAYAGDVTFTIDSNSDSSRAALFNFDRNSFTNSDGEEVAGANGRIINNSVLSVRDSNGFYRPVFVDNENKTASFSLPFTQLNKELVEFTIPDTIQPYQFYTKELSFDGMVHDIEVYVLQPRNGSKFSPGNVVGEVFDPNETVYDIDGNAASWEKWIETENGVYTMSANQKEYVWVSNVDKGEISFGNGIIGKQPTPNSRVLVKLSLTQGEDGNIIPNAITKTDPLYYTVNNIYNAGTPTADITSKIYTIDFDVINVNSADGGENTPSLAEIRRNAITNLRSKGKLVSDGDYDDINTIMGSEFPTVEAFPILKRSDIKVNEIMAFLRLQYHDDFSIPEIVPTRNCKLPLYDITYDANNKYTLKRNTEVVIDDKTYITLFNMILNSSTNIADYDYVLQNVKGSPATLYPGSNETYENQFSYIPLNNVDFDIDLENPVDGKYKLDIKANVNHIYSADMVHFRCRMITKWGSNIEYSQDFATYLDDTDTESTETTLTTVELEDFSVEKTYKSFHFSLDNYLEVPTELQRFEFYIDVYKDIINPVTKEPTGSQGWVPLGQYFTDVIVRQDLTDAMMSTITTDTDWPDKESGQNVKTNVHNVPVILKEYYDHVTGRNDNASFPNFEVSVIQKLISNLNLSQRRMLTDFVNIKLPDTYGKLNNLKYNAVDHIVESRFETPFATERPPNIVFSDTYEPLPSSSSSSGALELDISAGAKYIVNAAVPGYESKNLASYIDHVAEWYPNVDGGTWFLYEPKRGTYALVRDELDSNYDNKVIAYNGNEWIDVQDFGIPLIIEARVELDSRATITNDRLIENIKTNLMNHFQQYMGVHKSIDRSELLTVIRETDGVLYAELIKPEIDIRFLYDIKDLTQLELIDYTPQYVGFNEDTIQIEVI